MVKKKSLKILVIILVVIIFNSNIIFCNDGPTVSNQETIGPQAEKIENNIIYKETTTEYIMTTQPTEYNPRVVSTKATEETTPYPEAFQEALEETEIVEEEEILKEELWDSFYYNSIPKYGENGYWGPGMIIDAKLYNPNPEIEDPDAPQSDDNQVYYDDQIYKEMIDAANSGKDEGEPQLELYNYLWIHDGSNNTWKLKKYDVGLYKGVEDDDSFYYTGWKRVQISLTAFDMWRYFDPITKIMSIGWKYVPMITNPNKMAWYFFHPVTGCIQRGWLNYAGKTYYLVGDINSELFGTMLEGCWKIGEVVYYFEYGSGEKTYEWTVDKAHKYGVNYREII